jgi:spoIIIJ-associated protein
MKGKTVEEAIDLALQVLGRKREEVDIKIINEAEAGVLGVFGGKEAEVEVSPKLASGEQARELVQQILDKMGLITMVTVKNEEGDTIQLEIKGEDMGRIIGRAGATIDALQYLASIMLRRRQGAVIRVVLDAEGYRDRRKKVVTEEANEIAMEVEKTGKEIPLPPLSAAERRIIHLYIQENFPKLTSFSRGEGRDRQVVIATKREGE